MNIEFRASKSGLETCFCNNLPLHSNYNPEKEAEKFVDGISCNYEPRNIIITGPCLPYLTKYLSQKFPKANLFAIQYSKCFEKYDSYWKKVFLVNKNTNSINFQEELFNYFGEEELFTSLFLSWKPSENPFQNEYKLTWNCIKSVLDKCKSIIATISFFNKTWLFNSLHFYKYTQNYVIVKNILKDILITASGPSLFNQLEFIKTNRSSFFLLALSSSLTVLIKNQIIPDAILTTDGGYYAKRHLRILETNEIYQKIPIILPPEGKIPTKLYETNPIIPLIYEDSFDKKIFDKLKLNFLPGKRNGTVSGTAAELALLLTDKNVYFAGLDLASSKGHSHTQENILETDNSLNDFKLKSTESRIIPSTFPNQSLEIYRNWFSTRDKSFYKRVFRLISAKDNLQKINNLDDIINKKVKFLYENLSNSFFEEYTNQNPKDKINYVIDFFESEKNLVKNDNIKIFDWFKISSYTDLIQYKRENEENKKIIYNKMKTETLKLIDEVLDFLRK